MRRGRAGLIGLLCWCVLLLLCLLQCTAGDTQQCLTHSSNIRSNIRRWKLSSA